MLSDYKAVVVNGHSEYWSFPGMDALDGYLRGGGNLIVLSGNTMLWRTSFNPDGTIMECRKYQGLPGGRTYAATGELWHSQDGRRGSLLRECGWPSWKLIGLDSLGFAGVCGRQFRGLPRRAVRSFPVSSAGRNRSRQGRHVRRGSRAAALPKAVGHEWDVRLPLLASITANPPAGRDHSRMSPPAS